MTATFGLASATFLLVLETRKTRKQAEKQRKELAFRAALVELEDNIINHRRWDPRLRGRPDAYWWNHPPQFTRLNELLGSVDIPPQLFAWMTVERGNIQIRDTWLRNELQQQPEGQVNNDLKNRFYWLDLYLVRLACYVVCEAKRQGFHKMAEGMEQAGIFKPRPWVYGTSLDEAAATTAKLAGLPDPNVSGCEQCRLAELIKLAHEGVKQQSNAVTGKNRGIEVAPGDFI